MPDEWYRYWLGALADSGVTGVRPVYRGSWNVPTTEITDPALLRSVLEVIFRKRRETELGMEASSVWWPLYGGLALYCKSENVVIEPGCCADLSDASRWHEVVDYKEAAWWPLPIGHPDTMGPVSCTAVDHQQRTRDDGPYCALGRLSGATWRCAGPGAGRA